MTNTAPTPADVTEKFEIVYKDAIETIQDTIRSHNDMALKLLNDYKAFLQHVDDTGMVNYTTYRALVRKDVIKSLDQIRRITERTEKEKLETAQRITERTLRTSHVKHFLALFSIILMKASCTKALLEETVIS
jgi:hypothetical protein